jgi:hypothetical protein
MKLKIIDPKIHGYLDYMAAATLAIAPSLLNFSDTAATASYIAAVLQFGYSIITAYPLGAVKMIPFTVHGVIEFATSLALVAMPWMAEFAAQDSARNFFVASGIGLMAVWLLTDYRGNQTGGIAAGVRSANRKFERELEEIRR